MPIYTRTGYKGQTSLINKTRVFKSDPRMHTIGTVDELNSFIGVVIAHLTARKTVIIKKELRHIQNDLLDIGSALAMPSSKPVTYLEKRVFDFEKLIDELTVKMPELNQFILPGGSKSGSLLHVARTVARRAERNLVELIKKEEIDQTVVKYMNRLSDLLFTMARHVNFCEKQKETVWKKK
jgi:cob(I)alamin adenosyltransferase